MKKLLSVILALVMILSLSTVAFAETTVVEYTPTAVTTFEEIEKTYTSENGVVVNETLSFTSEAKTTNPDAGEANLTVDNLTVSSLTPGKLHVTIPSLSNAGVYEWVIKENAGNTAGVTYSDAEVHVIVLVEYDNVNKALKIANTTSYIKEVNGEKSKTFNNTFASGAFTVEKDVTGNMANENDKFEITVTLTSSKPIGTNVSLAGATFAPSDWAQGEGVWTATKILNISKNDGRITFSDIPTGVTVDVVENTAADKMNGYTQDSIKLGENRFTGLTVADANSVSDTNIVVMNSKSTSVDTGIVLDSMPYVLLLAVAAMGLAVLLTKKRASRED